MKKKKHLVAKDTIGFTENSHLLFLISALFVSIRIGIRRLLSPKGIGKSPTGSKPSKKLIRLMIILIGVLLFRTYMLLSEAPSSNGMEWIDQLPPEKKKAAMEILKGPAGPENEARLRALRGS